MDFYARPMRSNRRRKAWDIDDLFAAPTDRLSNDRKLTALHIAAYHDSSDIHKLLEAGADPNVHNSHCDTPLHLAVSRRNEKSMRALLKAGADPNAQDIGNATPLHLAVRHDYYLAMDVLLAAGANPDAQNRDGNTPLHVASYYVNLRATRILLEAGADAALRNRRGDMPVFACAEHRQIQREHLARRHTPPILWRQIFWELLDEEKAKLPEALRTLRQTSLDRYG